MDNREANMDIKRATCVLEAIGSGLTLKDEHERETACVIAIQAIEELERRDKYFISVEEELEQYRDLGTVSSVRANLTFLNTYKRADADGRLVLILDKNGYCEELGATLEQVREAVEKMKPKKPIDRCMFKECPVCGNVEIEHCNHCTDCGQALDWSDIPEKENT